MARPPKAISFPSCSQSGRLSHSFSRLVHLGGSVYRRHLAASTCGAFPLHSAARRRHNSRPLPSPHDLALLSKESERRLLVASKRQKLTDSTLSWTRPAARAPSCSARASIGVSLCSAQSKRRRTSSLFPLRRPNARSCHARNESGLASRSRGALFQFLRSTRKSGTAPG